LLPGGSTLDCVLRIDEVQLRPWGLEVAEALVMRTDDEPASRSEADAMLRDWARRLARAHVTTREDQDFAQSQKSMIEQTMREYGGRFLFELIQNGYDAQPSGTENGRIAIVLADDEGPHGTLYVANTGCGFTVSNARRIRSLGLSDKPIGEGIGNKGVGFKSVLQICSTPEVYSTLPGGNPGFCFRFARSDDVAELVDGDPVLTQQVIDEVSLYSITVPADTTPDRVTALWAEGYATVVRLPLDEDASESVIERLDRLEAPENPVMLFLKRLERVTIRREASGNCEERLLTRSRHSMSEVTGDFDCDLVTLDGVNTYLLLSREVEPDAYSAVVAEAISHHQLDRRYAESTSAVKVSVAVPYAADDAQAGRCYTFLPLGRKAPSPFAGHLNAPFYTDLSRRDIDETNPLNRLLLDAAAGLCLDAAEALTRWQDDSAPTAVIDLLCWDDERLPLITGHAEDRGTPLTGRPLMPARTRGTWLPLKDAWRWPTPETGMLTADLATSACGAEFLPELPPERSRRLAGMMARLGIHPTPPPQQLAAWTETMLGVMLSNHNPIPDWDVAYSDIAQLFGESPEALRSRRILLTDAWELQPCASGRRAGEEARVREATPFFPPTTHRIDDEDDVDPDADLALPRSLSNRIFYVHSDLTWYVNRQQTTARKFLQDNRLVRSFETRGILEHIRTVLAESKSRRVAEDALRFVFNLSRSGARIKSDLAALGLRVPAAAGVWIPARSCLFSAQWPGTTGEELSLIASTPADLSAELHALAARLLAPPSKLIRAKDRTAEWVAFLRRIGVREVLPLNSVPDDRGIDGIYLTRMTLAGAAGLPTGIRDTWRRGLPEASAAAHPYTPYVATGPLWWLPGQGEWEQLPERVRRAMARQILRGLKGAWPSNALETGWERDRPGNKDAQARPTPLGVFLRVAAWLPTRLSGQGKERFESPGRCWTFPVRGDDGPPRFTPLLDRQFRELLDDDAVAVRRLRTLGLGVWGSDDDAPRLVRYLGELFNKGGVAEIYAAQFQNTYRAAWTVCARRGGDTVPFPPDERCYLVVDVSGSATALPLEPESSGSRTTEIVVAWRDDDQSLIRLMTDFGWRVLEVDAFPDTVAVILRHRLGGNVVRASGISPVVLLDGREFDEAAAAEARPVVAILPWLPLMVATLLEHQRGQFSHLGQRAFDEALDSLRRVRVAFAARVEVGLGQEIRPLPERMHGVLPVPHAEYPTLIVEEAHQLNWATLEAMAEPLAYLIGRRDYARTLRWAAERTQRMNALLTELGDDDIAEICDVSPEDVRTTRLRLQSSLAPLLYRLYPVVVHYTGAETADPLDPETSAVESEAEARDVLATLADRIEHDPGRLLDAALDAPDLATLQRQLEIPLREFNATLSTLGARYPAVDYSQQHAEDFSDHLRRHRDRLLDRLRWARLGNFTAYIPQPDWPHLRRIESIAPAPEWGMTVDTLSSVLMDEQVEGELTRLLGTVAPTSGPALPRLSDCARANAELINGAASTLVKIVRAWLVRRGSPIDSPWADEDTAGRTLLTALDAAGALDFSELSHPDVLRWLQVLDIWPTGMAPTDDLSTLGITSDDLDYQKTEERRQRAERARQQRIVPIDDEPFDLNEGFSALREALARSLDRTPAFLGTRRRFAGLQHVDEGPERDGRSGGGSGNGRRPGELSTLQKLGVGFAGEWLAYQWLAQQYGPDFTQECWVSKYREQLLPGSGDDGLGWDFEVPVRHGKHYYEVKTTLGEGGQVELGETQVRAAQENARNTNWRLLVITNVLNENRRIHMLRNPFHPASRGHYSFVGRGLRLRYVID
jgi:hypothetical protein